jgi:hypothetical protein
MANVKRDVPGTWLATVTRNGAPVGRAVVTFTSDGGLVERFNGRIEGLVGAWDAGHEVDDNEAGHNGKDEFRFMGYRYQHKLAASSSSIVVTPDLTTRLRGTCHLTGQDSFSCTVTADSLDAAENVVASPPPLHLKLIGARMKVVPE